MSMKGIDISNHQAGIDLARVPFDFVICKATEGTGFVDRYCDGFIQTALGLGRKTGVYHYATGKSSGREEAAYFYRQIKGYVGTSLLALDWEGRAVERGPAYALEFLDSLRELTGVRALIYMSKSVCRTYDWSAVAGGDYGLWCAQYADSDPTGYQESPWTDEKGMGAFPAMAVYQYSSTGRLDGYSGNLDLNIAYMDEAAWDRYASPGKAGGEPSVPPAVKPGNAGKLKVDGSFGPATVRRTQEYFGTVADGIVSFQPMSNKKYLHSAYEGCWQFLKTGYGPGSEMVRAMQRAFGAAVDGWAGRDTVLHMQAFLGVARDGSMGPKTVSAWQSWLNSH